MTATPEQTAETVVSGPERPVDRLREAARLMRERAERTINENPHSGEGWYAHLGPAGTSWINDREGHLLSTHGFPRHAEHLASWHPAVALAVAHWLEECARLWEYGDVGPLIWQQANAVAAAYLGTEAIHVV